MRVNVTTVQGRRAASVTEPVSEHVSTEGKGCQRPKDSRRLPSVRLLTNCVCQTIVSSQQKTGIQARARSSVRMQGQKQCQDALVSCPLLALKRSANSRTKSSCLRLSTAPGQRRALTCMCCAQRHPASCYTAKHVPYALPGWACPCYGAHQAMPRVVLACVAPADTCAYDMTRLPGRWRQLQSVPHPAAAAHTLPSCLPCPPRLCSAWLGSDQTQVVG